MPRAFVEDYSKLVAAQAASSFGKAVDPAIVAMLEGRIRKGVMVLAQRTITLKQAAQAVHDDLVMRGIARWSSLDIPRPVADAMAVLTADSLAPLFGMQTDVEAAANAMKAIYRYVALPSRRRADRRRLLLNPTGSRWRIR